MVVVANNGGPRDMKMTALVFRFPATPEGRQLLKDMLPGIRQGSVPPGFDVERCDFDDLAGELEDGYATYIDYLEGRGLDDLNDGEKADLAEWKKKQADKRRQGGGGK